MYIHHIGDLFNIRAKSILFCGGPFTDSLRQLEEASGDVTSGAVTSGEGGGLGGTGGEKKNVGKEAAEFVAAVQGSSGIRIHSVV